jgi:hypothetical protein
MILLILSSAFWLLLFPQIFVLILCPQQHGTKLGGLRIQLPAYTVRGRILFSNTFARVVIGPFSRCRQDEQVITETLIRVCTAHAGARAASDHRLK